MNCDLSILEKYWKEDSELNQTYEIDKDEEEQNIDNIIHQNINLNICNNEDNIAIMPANDTENNNISDHHF